VAAAGVAETAGAVTGRGLPLDASPDQVSISTAAVVVE